MNKIKFLLAITVIVMISSCSNDDAPSTSVLTVTTATPVVVANVVTLGGNVTNDGGKPVTERGICIGITANPTITTNEYTEVIGTGIGVFTTDVEIEAGTPANTTFHYRAYAKNADGIVYGENKTFLTVNTACPVVVVTGSTISTPTTWTAGNVYLINNTITLTNVLTIQPGTVIKLNEGSIYTTGSGKIIANGTATNKIIFTSFADDSYCGDTNADGAASQAQKGDWIGLYINGGTNNSFKYCDFLYAGANDAGTNSAIRIGSSGGSFTFDNCTFAHTLSSSSSLAYTFFTDANNMSDNAVSLFTNNVFYDNDRPILVSPRYNLNPNNKFHNPLNPTQKNLRNGIYFKGGTLLAGQTSSFTVTEVPYVCDGQFQAYNGSTLNVDANVVVKFVSPSDRFAANSGSIIRNPSAIFTSYKDDTVGGDTNGDGTATSPAAGNWFGFSNTVPGSTTYYQSPNIRFAAN